MRQDMLKRVGMLAASAAVCGAVAAGGLMMQGMRYVRPTAENWSLLPYAEPAAKVEQTVGWSSKGEEFSRDYVSLTGYDEQERPVYSVLLVDNVFSIYQRYVYRDGGYTQYSYGAEGFNSYLYETDARGRVTRCDTDGHSTLYWYDGDDEDPCRYEFYDASGTLAEYSETQTAVQPDGTMVKNAVTWDGSGAVVLETRYVYDARGNMLSSMVDAGSDGRTTSNWTWRYDDAAHTATCTRPDGSVDYYQFDEQGRVLSEKSLDPDGDLREVQKTEYTDVTR